MFDCLDESSLFLHLRSCIWSLIHGAVNEAAARNFLDLPQERAGYTPLCRDRECWSTVQPVVLCVIVKSHRWTQEC